LGAGHLGKIHMRLLAETEGFRLIGFFDPDAEKRAEAAHLFGVPGFASIEELIAASEAVDVVTPTLSHYECAALALRSSKHVFIEKPVTNTTEEAEMLIRLAHEADVKVQVGHVERFNPAFVAARPFCTRPMFIESHRLAQFNPRGTDVPVVMDLMIHDIDIILNLVGSPIKRISASGVAVVSDTPDIANARLEFANGCVANLTASRISLKNMRKTRIFQRDAYIAIDFLKKKSEIVRLDEGEGEISPSDMFIELANNRRRRIRFEIPQVPETNAIQEELRAFYNSIVSGTPVAVTLQDGHDSLRVAHQIVQKLQISADIIASNI
jgi:predicted dehydrogenase